MRAIYLSVPAGQEQLCKETAEAAYRDHGMPPNIPIHSASDIKHTSLLAQGFNSDWAFALALHERGKVSHFAMLHADVIPADGWLRTLLVEMDEQDCDVLSAVAAIKDSSGDSSTAIWREGKPWEVERLSLVEISQMPPTFSIDDCDALPDDRLLVNTGCLLVRLGDWALRTNAAGELLTYFTIRDRVVRSPDGRYRVDCQPEDWNFSRMAAEQGCKVMATRKVRTRHRGMIDFPNWRETRNGQGNRPRSGTLQRPDHDSKERSDNGQQWAAPGELGDVSANQTLGGSDCTRRPGGLEVPATAVGD